MRSEVSTFHKLLCRGKHHQNNGDGANERRYIDPIRNGDAFDTTGYSHPSLHGKDTPGKYRDILSWGDDHELT